MADVVETYTVYVFIFISLSSYFIQFLFSDHPCHAEKYYIVFFLEKTKMGGKSKELLPDKMMLSVPFLLVIKA